MGHDRRRHGLRRRRTNSSRRRLSCTKPRPCSIRGCATRVRSSSDNSASWPRASSARSARNSRIRDNCSRSCSRALPTSRVSIHAVQTSEASTSNVTPQKSLPQRLNRPVKFLQSSSYLCRILGASGEQCLVTCTFSTQLRQSFPVSFSSLIGLCIGPYRSI